MTKLVALFALSVLALGWASCFSPRQPGCAFSCASDGLCPSGYTCGGDAVCHRNDGQGTCDIDGGADDGAADGADDGAADTGG